MLPCSVPLVPTSEECHPCMAVLWFPSTEELFVVLLLLSPFSVFN